MAGSLATRIPGLCLRHTVRVSPPNAAFGKRIKITQSNGLRRLCGLNGLHTCTAVGSDQGGEMEPKHTNRLAKEQSPYLLQHKHNPVSVTLAAAAVTLTVADRCQANLTCVLYSHV